MGMRKLLISLLGGHTKEEMREKENLVKLQRQFIFYIGDYFHNFGCSCWFNQSDKDLILKKEEYSKIKHLFLRLKMSGTLIDLFEIKEIIDILELDENFSKSLELFYLEANKYEVNKLYYQLILLGFRQILPIITSNNYSFEDIKPNTIDELKKMDYMLNNM